MPGEHFTRIVKKVIPGPAVIFIVTRSVAQGRKARLVSVLGVRTGSIVRVAAATAGLSALLAASATATTGRAVWRSRDMLSRSGR